MAQVIPLHAMVIWMIFIKLKAVLLYADVTGNNRCSSDITGGSSNDSSGSAAISGQFKHAGQLGAECW
jgi:hypothetical protein